MNIDKYPVIIGETAMVFEFASEGRKGRVAKLVIYSKTNLHNFYNVGFGDKAETTGDIDDTIVTNNGDSAKVLATVAATLYTFTDRHPEAMVLQWVAQKPAPGYTESVLAIIWRKLQQTLMYLGSAKGHGYLMREE